MNRLLWLMYIQYVTKTATCQKTYTEHSVKLTSLVVTRLDFLCYAYGCSIDWTAGDKEHTECHVLDSINNLFKIKILNKNHSFKNIKIYHIVQILIDTLWTEFITPYSEIIVIIHKIFQAHLTTYLNKTSSLSHVISKGELTTMK